MAEHGDGHAPAHKHGTMDTTSQDKTFHGFTRFVVNAVIVVVLILLILLVVNG